MNKKIIIPILFLFTIFLVGCDNQAKSQNSIKETEKNQSGQVVEEKKAKVDKVEIVDFHSNNRCATCLGLERLAKETLEEFFQPELRDGIITFQSINVEEEQNKAIVEKYQARGSSIFINVIRGDKDDISEETTLWRLARQDEAYKKYFKEKIEEILK